MADPTGEDTRKNLKRMQAGRRPYDLLNLRVSSCSRCSGECSRPKEQVLIRALHERLSQRRSSYRNFEISKLSQKRRDRSKYRQLLILVMVALSLALFVVVFLAQQARFETRKYRGSEGPKPSHSANKQVRNAPASRVACQGVAWSR